jgi:hypothetical protein
LSYDYIEYLINTIPGAEVFGYPSLVLPPPPPVFTIAGVGELLPPPEDPLFTGPELPPPAKYPPDPAGPGVP